MRPALTIVVVLALQGVGFAQLLTSIDERPQFPVEIKRVAEMPSELAGNTLLEFVELGVIFDGGSYGAVFRRDDSHGLVIYFLHPGYWTEQAIKNKTQPIAVDLNNQDNDDVHLEVKPDSRFEKRLIELLNEDLTDKTHGRKHTATLTRVRNCIRDRKPLREIQKRFPEAFKD